MPAGPYVLSITAPDVLGTLPACPGAGVARVAAVETNAVAVADGSTLVVQPASTTDGAFQIRLQQPTAVGQPSAGLSGTISGRVVNTRYPFGLPTVDARAIFKAQGSDAGLPLVGSVSVSTMTAAGTISGPATMGNSAGFSLACVPGPVSWTLSHVFR
jgi:hypothetical protein